MPGAIKPVRAQRSRIPTANRPRRPEFNPRESGAGRAAL
jgi:hypothetical protein